MNLHRFCYLVLFVLLLVPALVLAHAFPQSSQPAKGAVLMHVPTSVSITFNGDLEPLFNKLAAKNVAGKVVSQGQAKVSDHDVLHVALGVLASGKYHVAWQVTAKDGHHSKGAYTFTVKAG